MENNTLMKCTRLTHEWTNNNQLQQGTIKLMMIVPSLIK